MAGFLMFADELGQLIACGAVPARESVLDDAPPRLNAMVAVRQRPDRMQVIGQQYESGKTTPRDYACADNWACGPAPV